MFDDILIEFIKSSKLGHNNIEDYFKQNEKNFNSIIDGTFKYGTRRSNWRCFKEHRVHTNQSWSERNCIRCI